MKVLLAIIFIGAIMGGVYYYFFMQSGDTVEVTGNIQVSQQGNFDINAPQVSGPLYMAVVKGTAKNNSDEPLKNVFIKYNVAGQNTSAMIFDIGPGQQIEFYTNSVKTRAKNPSYYLDGVQYEDYNL
jgi:hypothetical protein